MLAQRAQQIDPRHPVERVVGERDRLPAVHDPHRVVHLLVARHRRVELGRDVTDERQRDVGEHHAPAVGRGRRIALDDPDAVAGSCRFIRYAKKSPAGPPPMMPMFMRRPAREPRAPAFR